MSRPRYDWWPYVKGMIRRYPDMKDRDVSGLEHCEKEAVRAAVSTTECMRNGRDRLMVIKTVFWDRSHTLEGAALQIPCSYDTAQRYHSEFVKEVAKHFACNGLL